MITAKKDKLGITISSKVKQQAEDRGKSLNYPSTSVFIEDAISYYSAALDKEKEFELLKEIDDLKKAVAECKKIKYEYDKLSSIVIKLVTKYPELAIELNEIEKEGYDLSIYKKRVNFE